jgi:hypothetical protein
VLYVPQEPAISRMAGEIEDSSATKNPLMGYGMSCILLAMSFLFVFSAWLGWHDLDLHWDSNTRRFILRRFGEGKGS